MSYAAGVTARLSAESQVTPSSVIQSIERTIALLEALNQDLTKLLPQEGWWHKKRVTYEPPNRQEKTLEIKGSMERLLITFQQQTAGFESDPLINNLIAKTVRLVEVMQRKIEL